MIHEDEKLNQYINESWIRYKRSNAIDKVNESRSSFNNDSQFIIHHEYSDDENQVNLIPLKNNLTYQGTVTDGQSLILSNNGKFIDKPMVDYRNYTSLNSGYNQELGTDNITLTFTFTDQVIRIEEGDECIITIPNKDENGLPPLFPYDYININDTAFVRNGSFASNIPCLADKIYKFQNESEYSGVNNYTYLCTWLYQPNPQAVPVWLDRYYYPDLLNRKAALKTASTGGIFDLSFENILDKFYLKETFTQDEINKYNITPEILSKLKQLKTTLKQETFIDKKSDLTLSPGTKYKYSRISKDEIDEIFDSLSPYRAEVVKDQYSNDVSLEELTSLNGENWKKMPPDFFGNSQQLNFNTNIFLSPYKKMGIQLFGMDYKHGFNIQNRKDLSPFSYYASEDTVYMVNNSFIICNQFNVFEAYNEKITYLALPAPFEDIYILSPKSIFIFDYDLRLKNRIAFSDIQIINEDINIDYSKLSDVYVLQYDKNLYCVVSGLEKNRDRILKIILNPAENETALTMRLLEDSEYHQNITVSDKINIDEVTASIKSLYMSADAKLYAFNYDILKVAHDNDTAYGIIKEESNLHGNWYYIFNQSLSKIQISTTASKYAEFTSDISIDNLAFGPDGSFALVRGFDNTDKDKTLEIFDKSKTKVYNYPLKGYTDVISLDYYRYIDAAMEEHDVYIALLKLYDSIIAVEYQIDTERVIVHNTALPGSCIKSFKSIIDSNKILPYLSENNLYFNLFINDDNNCITYKWNLNEIEEGWYNIDVKIDIDNAIYQIKINDGIVADFNSENIPEFKKHRYTNVSLLDGVYYLGTLGKRYGTTLNEILKGHHHYDPYAWKNSKVRNTTLYNKTLDYYEYQSDILHFDKINPLTLTIPCGIRNGIEEIVRYFKFNKPASYTNKIKINIGGISDDITMQA